MTVRTNEHAPRQAETPRQAAPQLLWPNYARIVASCMVVVIHTVGTTVTHTAVGSHMWWGALLMDSAASWAVPVFAMMSGALLLGAPKWRGTGYFYRRRLSRIGLPVVVWVGIYLAWRHWHDGDQFGVREAARSILTGFPYFHLYFLFVVLGLYAITPFLRTIVQNISRGELFGLTAGCLALTWLNGYIGITLHVPNSPNALSFFLPYIGYFLAGYLLRDVVVTGWRLGLLVTLLLATIVGEGIETYSLGGLLTPLGKYSALTITMSLLAFVALVQLGRIATERGYSGRVSRPLADAAFGVYLLHPIVVALLAESRGYSLRPATVGQLAIVLPGTIVLCWVVMLAVRRVPLLNRTI